MSMIGRFPRRYLTATLVGMVFLSSCAPKGQESAQRNTSSLSKTIAPADPSAYRAVRVGAEWRNPFLIVSRDGIEVRSGNSAVEGVTMPVTEVLPYLEKLPAAAWPYGLVVAVQEAGLRGVGDDVPIKKNREQLLQSLQSAGVKVDLWPSA